MADYLHASESTMRYAMGSGFNVATDTLEKIRDAIDMLEIANGVIFDGTCASGMTASTTTIVVDELIGWGEDFFNDQFYLFVLRNANSTGNAPQGEYQQITDFASATGTLTTGAFTGNVEENDSIAIIHRELLPRYIHGVNNLDHLIKTAVDTNFATTVADDSVIGQLATKSAASDYDRTKHSLENLYDALVALEAANGLVFDGTCEAGMTPSTTSIVVDELAGWGDDFFNNWFMFILRNANSSGNAPQGEYQAITDYTSTTGTFTTNAFTGNVEENDAIAVVHRELLPRYINEQHSLDHLLGLDGATQVYPENCATDSILAKMLVKADPAVPSQFDNSTDSLEAIADALAVVDGFHDVPAQDAATNTQMRDVIGNKTDTIAGDSLVSLAKIIDGVVDGIQTDLSNATDGLGALKTLIDAIQTDVGDPSARTNLQNIEDMLGCPDAASSSIYDGLAGNIDAVNRVAGKPRVASAAIDMTQAAATYDLLTSSSGVIIESIVIFVTTAAAGGALTSVTVQTDQNTAYEVMSAVQGATANLTLQANKSWGANAGPIYLEDGGKLQYTINGGAAAAGAATVYVKYTAATDGAYLS